MYNLNSRHTILNSTNNNLNSRDTTLNPRNTIQNQKDNYGDITNRSEYELVDLN